MKTAVHFLYEWADGEAWKTHIINEVISKNKIDPPKLLDDVLHLINTKETVDILSVTKTEQTNIEKLIINEIKTPKNINALSSDAQFNLGKGLNVFYGENGSGKSSYVRMFRKLADHYFTSEKDLTIIPNVYYEKPVEERALQTVEVTYLLGENKTTELVDINKSHSNLRKMNVFDSESVLPLINSDLTFSILPKGFEKFQVTSDLLDMLRKEISDSIDSLKERKDKIFADSSYDFIREELDLIMKSVTEPTNIKDFLNSNYPRSESHEEVIEEIDLQIKELESSSPKDKITILSAQKSKLKSFKDSFIALSTVLSQENVEKVNNLIKDYEQKFQDERKYNEEFQKNVSFLETVNDEWFSFVKSGKKYYDSIKKVHIQESEPCIFCSQPLDLTGVQTIQNSLSHISNSGKGLLNSIEQDIMKRNIKNVIINLSDEEAALFESEKFLERIKMAIQLVNRNKDLFNSHLISKEIIPGQTTLDVTDIVIEINEELKKIDDRILNLNKGSNGADETIHSLKALKKKVKKNEKLHSSIDSLDEWYKIGSSVSYYDRIKTKFSTNSLTQKQSMAFKKIVQDDYIETFEHFTRELKVPNVDLRIIPKKGKTLRNKFVSSEGYKVSQIMSEGEQKAVAMAEFATDLTMRKDYNTILLDDPVTSLDYKRSEMIANLICQLSSERQVIVFTHNITFYYSLYNFSGKKNKENKFFKVDEFDKMTKGIVSESFSGRLETLKEITRKLKEQGQTINSKSCIGDVLEEALKKAYADIRTWCELIIEEGFFKSVIRRHEPNIMFTKVKSIDGEFVGELSSVNDLFEKSCRWMAGHSQPIETQHNRANREAFNEDMKYILQLYEQYK